MLILYSNRCPQCKVLKNLLNSKNIKFIINSDINEMKALGITHLPVLKTEDGKLLSFKEAYNMFNEVD